MQCIFCCVWHNNSDFILRKCCLYKNRGRKGLKKQKRQVLPVVVPEAKTGEFILPLSFLLLLFSALFFLPWILPLPLYLCFPSCLLRRPSLSPPPVFLLPMHLSVVFVHFTPPLSFHRLSLCHFAVPSLFLTLTRVPLTSAIPSHTFFFPSAVSLSVFS